jgi:hypothetical protein
VVLAKSHTNTTAIRIMGELAFEVTGHNNLSMLNKLLMQLQSGGFKGLHSSHRKREGAPTMVEIRGQRDALKEYHDAREHEAFH